MGRFKFEFEGDDDGEYVNIGFGNVNDVIVGGGESIS